MTEHKKPKNRVFHRFHYVCHIAYFGAITVHGPYELIAGLLCALMIGAWAFGTEEV